MIDKNKLLDEIQKYVDSIDSIFEISASEIMIRILEIIRCM